MNQQIISPNIVKALAHFTESGTKGYPARPALRTLHIEHGTAVATDGFILATAPTQTNGFTGNLDPAQLLNVAKTVKRCDQIDLVTDTDEPRAVAVGPDAANWGPLTITDEAYPNWRQVIPRAEDTDIQVQISPKLLDQLVKAAKAIDGETVHLRIRNEPDGKAIQFAITNGYDSAETIAGALMPTMSAAHDFTQTP